MATRSRCCSARSSSLAWLGSLIVFLVWLYRANANVRALGADGPDGLARPRRRLVLHPARLPVHALYRGARHLAGERAAAGLAGAARAGAIGFWWACCLGAASSPRTVSFRIGCEGDFKTCGRGALGVWTSSRNLLWMPAARSARRIIGRIQALQAQPPRTERGLSAWRLSSSSPSAPPRAPALSPAIAASSTVPAIGAPAGGEARARCRAAPRSAAPARRRRRSACRSPPGSAARSRAQRRAPPASVSAQLPPATAGTIHRKMRRPSCVSSASGRQSPMSKAWLTIRAAGAQLGQQARAQPRLIRGSR